MAGKQLYQLLADNPLTPSLTDVVGFQPNNAGATEMGASTWGNVQDAFVGKQDTLGYTAEDEANKSNDGTMSSASTTQYPTVYAAKTYTDSMVVGLLQDVGNFDASSNVFPSTGGSGGGGAILEGDLWFISVAGTLGGTPVLVGYSIRALVDTPGQTSGNWGILSSGLGYIPEDVANKSTNISADSGSDTKYPSVKAVEDYVSTAGGGTVTTVKVSVSSAQLLALSSFSPLMLIAAKGAGKLIRPIAFTFKLNYGTTTYTGGSLQIYYASGGSFMVQNSSYTNSSSIMYYAPIANTFIFDQSAINNNLVLSVSSAISNGDSTLDIYITYEVITI